jgi:hypothetical protein
MLRQTAPLPTVSLICRRRTSPGKPGNERSGLYRHALRGGARLRLDYRSSMRTPLRRRKHSRNCWTSMLAEPALSKTTCLHPERWRAHRNFTWRGSYRPSRRPARRVQGFRESTPTIRGYAALRPDERGRGKAAPATPADRAESRLDQWTCQPTARASVFFARSARNRAGGISEGAGSACAAQVAVNQRQFEPTRRRWSPSTHRSPPY